MPEPTLPMGIEARRERTESARLDNFVDGAFAFAITLLVISGANLPRNVAALEHALRGVPAFLTCFAQLATFWHGYVRWRDTIRLTDGRSLRLSLLLVLFALIFVFPLHLVYAAFFSSITNGWLSPDYANVAGGMHQFSALFACYGLSYACMAGVLALLFRHGVRHSPLDRADAVSARIDVLVWTYCAFIGLLSTALSLTLSVTRNPGLIGVVCGCCYALLGLLGPMTKRYRRHLEATLPA